ncbi:MAG: DUF3841 domain-containing protein [Promicromonosporaceae bacterium]|nr:DUF3841 domain-containing protein [Promicromonosporaceae bacterium]
MLHTFQTRDAYEVLREHGVLVADPALAEPLFAEAYEWMGKQMKRRLATSADGMLWLWARHTRREFTRAARGLRGEVLITVQVEREQALLSHFHDWHVVLNRGLLVPQCGGGSIEAWEVRFEASNADWDLRADDLRDVPRTQWPEDLRSELEASWESIFDPDT